MNDLGVSFPEKHYARAREAKWASFARTDTSNRRLSKHQL